MTTDESIKFVRSYYPLVRSATTRHAGWSELSYVEGMITALDRVGIISYDTALQLKQEVQTIYAEMIDTLKK